MATVQEWTRLTSVATLLCILLSINGANGQENYSIRLRDGDSDLRGRVEVYLNGVWGTVCDDDWDLSDAEVVCRQLGHSHALFARTGAHFGEGYGPIVYDDVHCLGTESMLSLCPLSTSNNCVHSEDAGVTCSAFDSTPPSPVIEIRLVNGGGPSQGRVEVFVDGSWGTVCDDEWDIDDARVVCRQLGYSGATSVHNLAYFGPGLIQIALDNVRCTGQESRLQDCASSSLVDCSHSEDAGVACASNDNTQVRLVDGSTSLEGRVEVLLNGVWGTVCDDSWGVIDATVVCHQLGFGDAVSAPDTAEFGEGTVPIVMDDVECTGTESNLADCVFSTSHNCVHSEDAGAICSESSNILRLVDGGSASQGRLMVYLNGEWGTVCDDGWDINDASVVCRQLGYEDAVSAVGSAHFGQGSGTILLSDVECTGMETNLLDCPRSTAFSINCGHNEDAGVICGTSAQQKTVRLAGGSDELRGRVEVYNFGEWGTVCDNEWDFADATVVCRELGYQEALTDGRYSAYLYGASSGTILYDKVKCRGTESSLQDCPHSSPFACSHIDDASVSCGRYVSGNEFGEVRLVDGSSEFEGYVEVYYNQQWGTICNDYWDIQSANVVCNELGFTFAISTSDSSDYDHGRYSAKAIVLSEVFCDGYETRLVNCDHGGWDDNFCSHTEDVWVKCNGAPALGTGGYVAIAFGVIGCCILFFVCCRMCVCKKTKPSTTSTTTVPTSGGNSGVPVVHYHPPPQQYGQPVQSSVITQPYAPMQPTTPYLPAGEAPPPTYDTVVAQPTQFPPVAGTIHEIPHQPADPKGPPAYPSAPSMPYPSAPSMPYPPASSPAYPPASSPAYPPASSPAYPPTYPPAQIQPVQNPPSAPLGPTSQDWAMPQPHVVSNPTYMSAE